MFDNTKLFQLHHEMEMMGYTNMSSRYNNGLRAAAAYLEMESKVTISDHVRKLILKRQSLQAIALNLLHCVCISRKSENFSVLTEVRIIVSYISISIILI